MQQVTDKLYHIMLYQYTSPWGWFKPTMLVVIVTDCIGSCKSNYHAITTTTIPRKLWVWISLTNKSDSHSWALKKTHKTQKQLTLSLIVITFSNMSFIFILQNHPIKMLYLVYTVFWLDSFGVWVCNSYFKVLWPKGQVSVIN